MMLFKWQQDVQADLGRHRSLDYRDAPSKVKKGACHMVAHADIKADVVGASVVARRAGGCHG